MRGYTKRLRNPNKRPKLGDKVEAMLHNAATLVREAWTPEHVLVRLIRSTVVIDRLGKGNTNVDFFEVVAGPIFDHNGVVYPHHIDKAVDCVSWPMDFVPCEIARENLFLYLQVTTMGKSLEAACKKRGISHVTNWRYRKRALNAIARALNEREVPLEL